MTHQIKERKEASFVLNATSLIVVWRGLLFSFIFCPRWLVNFCNTWNVHHANSIQKVLTWSIKHDQHRGVVGNKIIKSTVWQMHNITGNITPFFFFWGRGGRSRTTERHKKNNNYYILDKGPWNSDLVHMNLYSSLFPTLYNVETWENFWINMSNIVCGVGAANLPSDLVIIFSDRWTVSI